MTKSNIFYNSYLKVITHSVRQDMFLFFKKFPKTSLILTGAVTSGVGLTTYLLVNTFVTCHSSGKETKKN